MNDFLAHGLEIWPMFGVITADGCIAVNTGRKNPYALSIASRDKDLLPSIRDALQSNHSLSK